MSFLRDTQESTALVFPELDIEVLALNLQFSRLDDVIHFVSEAIEFREWNSGMEEKFLGFLMIFVWEPCLTGTARLRQELHELSRTFLDVTQS